MEHNANSRRSVAYFSMEIGIDERVRTYSGGLGVLAGWWVEGHIEGLTGWSIGDPVHGKGEERDHSLDTPSLYDKLEHAVVPLFYHDRRRFMDMMGYSIAINGSFFNTQRMVYEYVLNAYFNR